jgi:hypothetical protein
LAKEGAGDCVRIGITTLPDITRITEENLLAVKAILDLLAAGAKLYRIKDAEVGGWQILVDAGEDLLTVATMENALELTASLESQLIAYCTDAGVAQSARAGLERILASGTPITAASLKAPKEDAYKIVDIEDGERGWSLERLFGRQLASAKRIKIVDPYIRTDYQVRRVEDLLKLVSSPKDCVVELQTMYEKNERFGLSEEEASRNRLDALKAKLGKQGMNFSYEFDDKIHDRCIETEGWQIALGRGLDIYYPPDRGRADSLQNRRTRKCRIIYLPREKAR